MQGAADRSDGIQLRAGGEAAVADRALAGGPGWLLAGNEGKPARERLTLIRIFEELRGRGYEGSYDALRRYAKGWRRGQATMTAAAYVPLSFAPGEAYQFDWSHEIVLINGTTVSMRVAHVRLCHSRKLFVRADPRETQEMVFDAHDRAFAFFKGCCTRGIYDNMKAAVDAIFVGKEWAYNRRFLQMCSHYLVDTVENLISLSTKPAAGQAEVAKLQSPGRDRMNIHKNARLTPLGREHLGSCGDGW